MLFVCPLYILTGECYAYTYIIHTVSFIFFIITIKSFYSTTQANHIAEKFDKFTFFRHLTKKLVKLTDCPKGY